jgi:NADP-dependent 3-hydroxy acid dehydrogenase YdfG
MSHPSPRPLDGKVALVTGASSGIGQATAVALASAGARVVIAARRADRLAALADRIAAAGGETLVVQVDLEGEGEIDRLVATAAGRWGGLDVLVNNAGVMLLAPVIEATAADLRRMVELNLLALMQTTTAALPHLKASAGHIVNIASVAGRVANPNASAYAATKFGVVGYSEALRREVYVDRVRVTVVEPGLVHTELSDHITNAGAKAGLEKRLASEEPLEAEDVANAILYAVTQPPRVAINEILIRPTGQER